MFIVFFEHNGEIHRPNNLKVLQLNVKGGGGNRGGWQHGTRKERARVQENENEFESDVQSERMFAFKTAPFEVGLNEKIVFMANFVRTFEKCRIAVIGVQRSRLTNSAEGMEIEHFSVVSSSYG
jgi:hypothetical protein